VGLKFDDLWVCWAVGGTEGLGFGRREEGKKGKGVYKQASKLLGSTY